MRVTCLGAAVATPTHSLPVRYAAPTSTDVPHPPASLGRTACWKVVQADRADARFGCTGGWAWTRRRCHSDDVLLPQRRRERLSIAAAADILGSRDPAGAAQVPQEQQRSVHLTPCRAHACGCWRLPQGAVPALSSAPGGGSSSLPEGGSLSVAPHGTSTRGVGRGRQQPGHRCVHKPSARIG
jgi:hypothetical protein